MGSYFCIAFVATSNMIKIVLFSVVIMTLIANAMQQSSCPVASCTPSFIVGGSTSASFCTGELIITPNLPRTYKYVNKLNTVIST